MAAGDWAPGSRAASELVQIVVDDQGRVTHCGIGFHILAPSGRVLAMNGGHTWGGPDGTPPEPQLAALQALVDQLRAEAAQFEGITFPSSSPANP